MHKYSEMEPFCIATKSFLVSRYDTMEMWMRSVSKWQSVRQKDSNFSIFFFLFAQFFGGFILHVHIIVALVVIVVVVVTAYQNTLLTTG